MVSGAGSPRLSFRLLTLFRRSLWSSFGRRRYLFQALAVSGSSPLSTMTSLRSEHRFRLSSLRKHVPRPRLHRSHLVAEKYIPRALLRSLSALRLRLAHKTTSSGENRSRSRIFGLTHLRRLSREHYKLIPDSSGQSKEVMFPPPSVISAQPKRRVPRERQRTASVFSFICTLGVFNSSIF